ncbi:hypothetical protein ACHAXR_005361 [Thalassiosira sp. AJA248-18]
MKSMMKAISIAAVFLSFGILVSAKEEVGFGNTRGQRRKRTLKKTIEGKAKINGKHDSVMDEEDVTFWTRLLQGQGGSMGPIPKPTTPNPTFNNSPVLPPSNNTPRPTRRQTPNPTRRPTAPPQPAATDNPTPSPTTPAPTDAPMEAIGACGLTASQRRAQIIDKLSDVSSASTFNQVPTPQRLALDWIVDEDGAQLCPDDASLVQRYTLAVFYYSTNNNKTWKKCAAPQNFNPGSVAAANAACTLTTVNATTIFPDDVRGTNAWLTPDSECLWGGISCHPANSPNANQVNVVEFEGNGLAGTLPSEMEQLDSMRFFALERESLTGPIPASYGNLKSLLLLDFDFNKLDGELPSSLWGLTNLRQLDLNNNKFSGTLSGDIGQLKQLRFFQIDNNNMEGAIPSALGDITNFSLIGLSGNKFEGAMPDKVCDLRPSPLQTLVVDCDIECSVPECCTSCVK